MLQMQAAPRKANLICPGVEQSGNLIFVSENEYATGRRTRPRGPNVKTIANAQGTSSDIRSGAADSRFGQSSDTSLNPIGHTQQKIRILPGLVIPQEDQALTYYARHHVEVPDDWPGIADRWDNHLRYALDGWSSHRQKSVLGLAILAVSQAAFGRTRHDYAASAAGSQKYSEALVRTNTALTNPKEASSDEVLLAAMLLSFYENVILDKTTFSSDQDLELIASRSFAHHDGAVSMLKLRQQLKERTSRSMELDMLVRRQLMRTLLLRCMPIPSWLRSGARFGEHGLASDLDCFMIRTAKVRHQFSKHRTDMAKAAIPDGPDNLSQLGRLLADAQTLDDVLIIWAGRLPAEFRYSTSIVQDDRYGGASERIFDGIVHIYSTTGHTAVWNRWRSIRLILNDIMLKILPMLNESVPNMALSKQAAKSRIHCLVDDLCASIPYILGILDVQLVGESNGGIVVKVPASLKESCKAGTASLLCWPLNEAIMVSDISERQRCYLKNRILDVSEIVDDGIMERIAAEFSTAI
ncbi:MAG: hypothetical protein Q9216_001721 [Gyalolechia sp. 2 TL-2023]